MPRILPLTVLAAMFLCLVLGNSRAPGECPVHHSVIRPERVPVEHRRKDCNPRELVLLKENPYTGFAADTQEGTIFPLQTVKVGICSQCRSNYLVATSLSPLFSESLELSVSSKAEGSEADDKDGPLFRNIQ